MRLPAQAITVLAATVFFLAARGPACADSLVLPAPVLDQDGTATVLYHLDNYAIGLATLSVDWTDALGRVVDHRDIKLRVDGKRDLPISLDLSRAVAMRNTLHARLVLANGVTAEATLDFLTRRPAGALGAPWQGYRVIMWQEQTPAAYRGLRALGVTGAKVTGIRGPVTPAAIAGSIAAPLAAETPWFVENLATDFYSAYHRWTPEHPGDTNWRFLALQKQALAQPADPALTIRDPSLSDPAWIARITARLAANIQAQSLYRPLYYNLADESGIADLSAAWDFDTSPVSLAAFRDWLQRGYPSLAALNAQWGSNFPAWSAIQPTLTTEAMRRTDDNFSSWADFKKFMDQSFAAAIRAGTDAVHAADPTALAGIEGAQIPGWGGYNYAQLSGAVDLMELYDSGNNVEIAHSLNPSLILLTTSFGTGPAEQHAIWHEALLGTRGLILWDENGTVIDPNGAPKPRGLADSPTYKALSEGIGAQLIAAKPVQDPIAILYSPASFRTQWLLDQRANGAAWTQRGSEAENGDNAQRVSMRNIAATLNHAGLQPRWISSDQLEQGLTRAGALILPQAIALSDDELTAIRNFRTRGGLVLADGQAGLFDSHSRRRAAPPLADLPQTAPASLPDLLAANRITPGFHLAGLTGAATENVDIRAFTDGDVTLLALQQDSATPQPVQLTLPQSSEIRDILTGAVWRRTSSVRLTLDPVKPTILAISQAPLLAPQLSGPAARHPGETARFTIGVPADRNTAHVVRIEAIDPSGVSVPYYADTLTLRQSATTWTLPLAFNDKPGTWTIRVKDILSDTQAETKLKVAG